MYITHTYETMMSFWHDAQSREMMLLILIMENLTVFLTNLIIYTIIGNIL